MKKRICSMIALILVIAIFIQIQPDYAAQSQAAAFTGEVQSLRFSLKCDEQTGNISLLDKSTNQQYFGVPENAESDSSKGLFKIGLMSQIILRGVNLLTNQIADIMSYASSVKKNNVQVEQISDGFRVTYLFATEKIEVPVLFQIDENKFTVTIETEKIVEGEKFIIKDVELLPYFGAGGKADEGFMFIPDGSGAIINFNNGKSMLGGYSAEIYGRDNSFYLKQKPIETEIIRLPILGIERNGSGFLAVAENGAAAGKIMADVSGNKTGYNNAYFGFTIHSTDTVYINKDTWYEKGVLKYNKNSELDTITVAYYFSETKNGGIPAMVDIYRGLLAKDNRLSGHSTDQGLFVDIIQAIDVNRSILGVPVDIIEPLTTFEQTKVIINQLLSAGIENISVKLTNSTAAEIKSRIRHGFAPLRSLGGSKEFLTLLATDGAKFYPDIEVQQFNAGFLEIPALFRGVKSLSNEISMKYSYDIATYNIRSSASSNALLKISRYSGTYRKILADLNRFTKSISVGDLGNELYSDFNKRSYYSRQQALDEIKRIYHESLAESEILSTAPNDYAIADSAILFEVPDKSSNYDIFDYDIPFYGMVLNGIRNFSYEAINLQADDEIALLKSMEVGAFPLYTLFYQKSESVKETDYSALFSCNYLQWTNHAELSFNRIKEFRKNIGNGEIVGFEILERDFHRIHYKNGRTVLFNLTQSDKLIDGIAVKAKSYQIIS